MRQNFTKYSHKNANVHYDFMKVANILNMRSNISFNNVNILCIYFMDIFQICITAFIFYYFKYNTKQIRTFIRFT